MNSTIIRTALAAILLGGPIQAATFQPIGSIGDGSSNSVSALSSDGSTVAGSGAYLPSGEGGFIWTQAAGFRSLPEPSGGSSTTPTALSADGSVAVGRTSDASQAQLAFRWTEAGGLQILGTLHLSNYSAATGVSADGSEVVGVSGANRNGGGMVPMIWTASGGMIQLPSPAPGEGSANAISADGSTIVGSFYTIDNGALTPHATRWRFDDLSIFDELPSLRDLTLGSALAVNADGSSIVGVASTVSPNSGQTGALLWSDDADAPLDLGNLGPSIDSNELSAVPSAISADGSIIAGWFIPKHQSSAAFIWTAATGMQRLQDVLEFICDTDLSGWQLTDVSGISADGHTLAGNGIAPDGKSHGWIVTGVDNIPAISSDIDPRVLETATSPSSPKITVKGRRYQISHQSRVRLQGTASHVRGVSYRIGKSVWKTVQVKHDWSVSIKLHRGLNQVTVRGEGRPKDTNALQTLYIFYAPLH